MKILCVIDSLGSGGAQRQLVELAKGFKEKGHLVSFIIYHNINFFRSDLEAAGIPVKLVEEIKTLKRIFKIRSAISDYNPDVVLSFLDGANFICEVVGFLPRKWKLIVGERSANPKIFSSFKLRFFKFFHLFANEIVYNSFSNQSIIRKVNPLLGRNKNHVIYNLIDPNRWLKVDSTIVQNKKFTLVIASSHQYLKNAAGLIEAVQRLEDRYKDMLQIEWYGDESPDRSLDKLKSLIREYSLQGIFKLYPSVKDIQNKYSYADAVGLFSFYEGFPNTICEAMTMGKVVITSNVSDISKVLDHCPQLIFDPRKIDKIQESLERLLELSANDRVLIGNRNRKKALHLFNKKKIISEYLKLITI